MKLENIPEELKSLRQWVCWKFVKDDKTQKFRKIPIDPKTGCGANSKNPSHWTKFDKALESYSKWLGTPQTHKMKADSRKLIDVTGLIEAIGFMFENSEYIGVDLDNCVDASGNIEPEAFDIVSKLNSYTEFSQSGKGLHIICKGKLPAGGKRKGKIEMYGHGSPRGFIMTGNALSKLPIRECQQEIDAIHSQYIGGHGDSEAKTTPLVKSTLSDAAILEKLKSHEKFQRLYFVGWENLDFESRSDAELSLCNILAGAGADEDQIDRLFRKSILMDPKWDRIRQYTIPKAIRDNAPAFNSDTQNGNKKTEDAIAEVFATENERDLRYCVDSGKWFRYDPKGKIWRGDSKNTTFNAIRMTVRSFNPNYNATLGKAAFVAGVEKLCKSDPRLAVTADEWDKAPMRLGTPGKIISLDDPGAVLDERACRITKSTITAPLPGRPEVWLNLLNQITFGDSEFILYLQRLAGYCLTADTREQALFFFYGTGENGKGLFINTLMHILADYGKTATMDTFVKTYGDKHSTDLAELAGARLVTSTETDEGRSWKTSLIKAVTGGDSITARFMFQNNFTFKPKFKLVISSNFRPRLNNVDIGMKRRLHVIPFKFKAEKRDNTLQDKLYKEAGQIFSWMIEGCRDWLKNGLPKPKAVKFETEDYFDLQDVFGQWLNANCVQSNDEKTVGHSRELYKSWVDFAESEGVKPGSTKSFASDMEHHGFRRVHRRDGKFWLGVRLKTGQDGDDGSLFPTDTDVPF